MSLIFRAVFAPFLVFAAVIVGLTVHPGNGYATSASHLIEGANHGSIVVMQTTESLQ